MHNRDVQISRKARKEFEQAGKRGGKARAKSLTPARRQEIARQAAEARYRREVAP